MFRGKPTEVHRGTFETKNGYVQDLSTLSRLQDMSLFEDEKRLVVYGYISLRDFKVSGLVGGCFVLKTIRVI